MAFPKASAVKLTGLNEEEKADFKRAQLYRLFIIMQRVVSEDIAEEAIRNFDKAIATTVIKGVTLHISKEELATKLRMSEQSQGHTWSPDQVAAYLGQSKEDVAKRKKGAQGIPTAVLKEQNKLMRFVAQVVCLKKDDKYLSKQVFMEAAKLLEGGKGDFVRILERAILNQMTAIKEKG